MWRDLLSYEPQAMRTGRFGFLTQPVLTQKLFIPKKTLQFRRNGMFIEKRHPPILEPLASGGDGGNGSTPGYSFNIETIWDGI